MGRWSQSTQEAKHVSKTVIDAVGTYGKDATVVMNNRQVIEGRVYKASIHNTNGQEPVSGDITIQDSSGNAHQLDPLDIMGIK